MEIVEQKASRNFVKSLATGFEESRIIEAKRAMAHFICTFSPDQLVRFIDGCISAPDWNILKDLAADAGWDIEAEYKDIADLAYI